MLLFCSSDFAQAEPGQYAQITVDSAMIYDRPDFDAKVIGNIKGGKRVIVSKRRYGAFRRILVKKGLFGFVSEVDVKLVRGSADPKTKDEKSSADKSKKNRPREKKSHRQKPVAETRYVGLLLGYVNYKEEVGSLTPASNEITYGLRVTGPNLILKGPYLLDLNLAFHVGAPKYYAPGADVTPAGFFGLIDLSLLLPIFDRKNSMGYLGLGPHLNYGRFNVVYGRSPYILEELRFGAVATLGYGFRMGNTFLRFDYRYYWDTVKYSALQSALQLEF